MSVRSHPSATSKKQQRVASPGIKALGLWLAAAACVAALLLCVGVGSRVPLLPWLWAFVPTLAVLSLGLFTAALFARDRITVGVIAGLVSVSLVAAWGVMLRYQNTRAWVALQSEDQLSIQRRVQVPLLEAVSVSGSVKYVRFSPALYDSIAPSCGDEHCLTFGGLERTVSWSEEVLTAALAAARLGAAPADVDARIHLDVQQERDGGVVTIAASLRDTQGEFATMRIRRPDPDRAWSSALPPFLHYVLEHNPLAAVLYHRPEANRTPVASFLREAIEVAAVEAVGEWRGRAQVVREETVQPRRLQSGTPEAIEATKRRPMDPRCAERATLVPPERGTWLGYVVLASSQARIPFPAFAQVICRNDHLYVLTYGGEWGMHTFHRYALDGASAGVYRVGHPDEMPLVSPYGWVVDVDSLEEGEGRLTYAVDGWRREVVTPRPPRREDLIHERRLVWQIPIE